MAPHWLEENELTSASLLLPHASEMCIKQLIHVPQVYKREMICMANCFLSLALFHCSPMSLKVTLAWKIPILYVSLPLPLLTA